MNFPNTKIMIKKLSIALCCCAIWMFSSNFVLAQGKAKVFIKKNINGKVEEESREINLEGGEDIDAILRELGIIDEIGQLKPGQEFEIKIDKISPEGGSENIKFWRCLFCSRSTAAAASFFGRNAH
jgi:hypothetical protein